MSKRIIDYDPLTRVSTFHDYDHSTKMTYITQEQDVQAVLDHNKELANDSSYKQRGIKEDYYHFARVPNVVLMEIMKKHNISPFNKEDLPKFEKILSSNEYSKLLTVDKI